MMSFLHVSASSRPISGFLYTKEYTPYFAVLGTDKSIENFREI
jgi:hypothetical protein